MKPVMRVDRTTGEVFFHLIREAVDEWNFETYTQYLHDPVEMNRNPVPIIRGMQKELEAYIRTYKPKHLAFAGNTSKKQRIYEKLLKRNMSEGYTVAIADGVIWLYRLYRIEV